MFHIDPGLYDTYDITREATLHQGTSSVCHDESTLTSSEI